MPWKPFRLLLVMLLLGVSSWWVSDVVERDNDFCNACHLSADIPLHIEIRKDFDLRPSSTLAGVHGSAATATRAEREAHRCIDCHGGVGFEGRARVKLLAAKDALVWLGGQFDEPGEMKHPLRDADCRKCHTGFRQYGEQEALEKFHGLMVHNIDLGLDCVECHTVHDGGDDPELYFLDSGLVRSQCGRCHVEFRR